jgi:aquaporin Z
VKAEYGIEAAALGLFMISAAVITALIDHPSSPVRHAVADPLLRRALVGIGMGLTAILLIYSPMGKRSGAHMNPAVTLTFWRMGKVAGADALAYGGAQFAGGVIGLAVAWLALGQWLADIAYIATRPGPGGALLALAAEAAISFGVMLTVLVASNTPGAAPYTGLMVGGLVACYITFEAPLSGMSMNPARTLAPTLLGGVSTPLWVYFLGPTAGMLAAGDLYARWHGLHRVRCAKLQHPATGHCIFCGGRTAVEAAPATAVGPLHPMQRPRP